MRRLRNSTFIGGARVELERQDAALERLVGVVDHLGRGVAVDLVGQVRAVGDDDVLVPVSLLDRGAELLDGHRQLLFLLLAVLLVGHFRAALRHDVAAAGDAGLVVDDAGEGVAGVEVGLVAADAEGFFGVSITFERYCTPELPPRIGTRSAARSRRRPRPCRRGTCWARRRLSFVWPAMHPSLTDQNSSRPSQLSRSCRRTAA